MSIVSKWSRERFTARRADVERQGVRSARWSMRKDGTQHVETPTRFNRIPSDAELATIPLVEPTVLEITDKETMKLRRRLYSLNRDNAIWRYRTMRENGLTLLWRLTR